MPDEGGIGRRTSRSWWPTRRTGGCILFDELAIPVLLEVVIVIRINEFDIFILVVLVIELRLYAGHRCWRGTFWTFRTATSAAATRTTWPTWAVRIFADGSLSFGLSFQILVLGGLKGIIFQVLDVFVRGRFGCDGTRSVRSATTTAATTTTGSPFLIANCLNRTFGGLSGIFFEVLVQIVDRQGT